VLLVISVPLQFRGFYTNYMMSIMISRASGSAATCEARCWTCSIVEPDPIP
jgi:hypothetical protein